VPRLTNKQHYTRHLQLRSLWLHDPRVFALLEPDQQAEVHRYFQPAKDLTERQLVAHRRQVSTRDPSLPNRAGKHYIRMTALLPDIDLLVPDGAVEINGTMFCRQPPEVRRLARACIELARWRREQGASGVGGSEA